MITEEKEGKKISIKADLESIIGLTWLGVLGIGISTSAVYGIYKCLPQHIQTVIQDTTYQICNNFPDYLSFVNS